MSYENAAMTENENDLWRVQVDGDMQRMTLDQLDDAFQAGAIDESTLVLAPGATSWTKLGDAAGLDDSAPVRNAAEASPVVASPPQMHVPTPEAYAYANSLAPLAVDSTAPSSMVGPYPTSGQSFGLDSLDSLDDGALKPKKGKVFAFLGVAIVLVGGLGFAASRFAPSTASAANALQGDAPKAAAVEAPKPATEDTAAANRLQSLTEEQRVKLLEADKAREAAATAKRNEKAARAPAPRHGMAASKSDKTFHNGGSKYDPLNGAL